LLSLADEIGERRTALLLDGVFKRPKTGFPLIAREKGLLSRAIRLAVSAFQEGAVINRMVVQKDKQSTSCALHGALR